MVKPWKQFRVEITTLYIKEARTLAEVKRLMNERHGFHASIRSYRQRFDQWNLQKYNCKKRQQRKQDEMQRKNSIETNLMYPSPPTSPENDGHALPVMPSMGVKGGDGRYLNPAWHFGGPLPQMQPHHQQRQRYLKQRHPQSVLDRKYPQSVARYLSAPWTAGYPVEQSQQQNHFLPPYHHGGFPQDHHGDFNTNTFIDRSAKDERSS